MRRLRALITKEVLQIFRDPSSILIAFVLPLLLLFVYGYGVNLDSNLVKIGLVLEDQSADVTSLSKTFLNSKYLDIKVAYDRRAFEEKLVGGDVRGIVVIPQDFTSKLKTDGAVAEIQVIADGAEPNIASFVQSYSKGILQKFNDIQLEDHGRVGPKPPITLDTRFWYNPELKSRNFLVPGSISLIMTLIGTLLTALVIAREWERGTMEALLATPITIKQILLGKLIPYFVLGICSMTVCFLIATLWYDVPFRGSFIALLLSTTVFLIAALGQGLLISTIAKDQFVASQMALMSAYLPSFMLSGFIFEISSMPAPIQALTHLFSARYFVTILHTLFLTGDIWPLVIPALLMMGLIGLVFFTLIARKTAKRLDQ